ncbi:MAG: hypothetical protein AAFR37_22080, partial [Cyanobacteria bacterium J06628_3]
MITNNKMTIGGLTSVSGPYIRARWSSFASKCSQHCVLLIEFGNVSKVYDWLPSDIKVPYYRKVLSKQPA